MSFVTTRKYARKPLIVDAIQVTADNFGEVARWCHGDVKGSDGSEVKTLDPSVQYIHIRVHNPINVRQSKAFVGDWILYTERGYKIYTNKAFRSAFIPAEPEPDVSQETIEFDTLAHAAPHILEDTGEPDLKA